MNGKLRKILAECIEAIESGADAESCLRRYPDQEDELRPLLRMWSDLDYEGGIEFDQGGYDRGHREMLTALADEERRGGRMVPFLAPALTKAAAVVAGVVLLTGVAGASAALGGPDIADEVLTVTGINHAPDAAQNGKDHANPNAFEGAGNAGQGRDNASEQGKEQANPKAGEGGSNGGEGSEHGQEHANSNVGEGSEHGQEHANSNAGEGSEHGQEHANSNAGEGSEHGQEHANSEAGEGSEHGQEHKNANASEGVENSTQGQENASEHGQEHRNSNADKGAENALEHGNPESGDDSSNAGGEEES